MAIDVRMPKLSDNMEEGVIIRWMKAPGDQVAKGEPLAEVETDKADVELEASESGVLSEIKVAEGESAAVGAVIATMAAPGETADASEEGEKSKQGEKTEQGEETGAGEETEESPRRKPAAVAKVASSPPGDGSKKTAVTAKTAATAGPPATDRGAQRAAAPSSRPAGRPAAAEERAARDSGRGAGEAVRASPLAWRMADDAGVNLASLRGSGPGGRILKRDVEASVRGPAQSSGQPQRGEPADDDGDGDAQAPAPGRESERDGEAAPPVEAKEPGGNRVIEATRMRLAIAKRMTEAKRDIPHFYVGAEIDMSEAMHLRESIKRREAMVGLTVTHLLLRALAMALVRHPRVNASWRENAIELHEDVNIGIAVAVEDGLVVPVLHRAQSLTLGEIAAQAAVLTEKARTGKFGGADLTGGTFSLSNVGMLDVEELVAVINPPQAAILAVAAVKDRPIVRAGQLAVAKTMRATLSCDHRVLNGVEGGRFLEELKGILENPVTLLLE